MHSFTDGMISDTSELTPAALLHEKRAKDLVQQLIRSIGIYQVALNYNKKSNSSNRLFIRGSSPYFYVLKHYLMRGDRQEIQEVIFSSLVNFPTFLPRQPWYYQPTTAFDEAVHLGIITPFLPAGTLGTFCKTHHITFEEKMHILFLIAIGIHHLQTINIIHRDIKPQNVGIVYDEAMPFNITIRIFDFGYAKQVTPAMSQSLSGTGDFPYYVAPECAGKSRITHTYDVYSWGMIAFGMFDDIKKTDPTNLLDQFEQRDFIQQTSERIINDYLLREPDSDTPNEKATKCLFELLQHCICDQDQRYTMDQVLRTFHDNNMLFWPGGEYEKTKRRLTEMLCEDRMFQTTPADLVRAYVHEKQHEHARKDEKHDELSIIDLLEKCTTRSMHDAVQYQIDEFDPERIFTQTQLINFPPDS